MERINHFNESKFSLEDENEYLKSLFKAHYDDNLKSKWEKKLLNKHNVSRSKNKGSRRNIIFLLIASGIAACVSAVILMTNFNSQDAGTFASTIFKEDAIYHPGVVKGNSNEEKILLDAARAFNYQDYSKAISIYNIYEKDHTLTEKEIYFKGISFLKIRNYNESTRLMGDLLNNETYKEEARWYYSLALLFDHKEAEAKASFMLIKENQWNYKNAQKIINKMK